MPRDGTDIRRIVPLLAFAALVTFPLMASFARPVPPDGWIDDPDAPLSVVPPPVPERVVPANRPPVAIAHPPFASVTVGEKLALSASDSYDPDGRILAIRWTFGTNGSVSQPEVVVVFGTPGIRNVLLAVTDDAGSTATTTVTIEVLPEIVPPMLILSAGSANLVEMATGGEAEVPLELVAYNDRVCGVAIEVLDDGGLTVLLPNLPDCVERGKTIRFRVRLRADDVLLRPVGVTVQLRVAGTGVASNVEFLDVMVRTDVLDAHHVEQAAWILASLGVGVAACLFLRRRRVRT